MSEKVKNDEVNRRPLARVRSLEDVLAVVVILLVAGIVSAILSSSPAASGRRPPRPLLSGYQVRRVPAPMHMPRDQGWQGHTRHPYTVYVQGG